MKYRTSMLTDFRGPHGLGCHVEVKAVVCSIAATVPGSQDRPKDPLWRPPASQDHCAANLDHKKSLAVEAKAFLCHLRPHEATPAHLEFCFRVTIPRFEKSTLVPKSENPLLLGVRTVALHGLMRLLASRMQY